MRYRFDVVAASAADVVTFAGGWLFDRVMAGWDVTVLLDDDDLRPIQIIGADTAELTTALAMGRQRPHPHSLAVSVDLFASNPLVREGVLAALGHGATEVVLWGETWPRELDRSVDTVEHHLSAAARAFKAQALAAVGVPTREVGRCEMFRSGMAGCLSAAADLVPAS